MRRTKEFERIRERCGEVGGAPSPDSCVEACEARRGILLPGMPRPCGGRTRGNAALLRAELDDAHPLARLLDEHVEILGVLDWLSLLASAPRADRVRLFEVEKAVRRLQAAAPHHRREEEGLFPVLRGRELYGPPAVLTAEHEELEAIEAEVCAWLRRALVTEEVGEWEEVRRMVLVLVLRLREHVAKEDHVLFPLALELLDQADWARVAAVCDAVDRAAR